MFHTVAEAGSIIFDLRQQFFPDAKIFELKTLPLTGGVFHHHTAIVTDDARVDISAKSFSVRGRVAFLDVKVFNPLASCYKLYKK